MLFIIHHSQYIDCFVQIVQVYEVLLADSKLFMVYSYVSPFLEL